MTVSVRHRRSARPGDRCPCAQCQADGADQARRKQREHEHGRNTIGWKITRLAAIARDQRCQGCGTTDNLTGHMDPHSPRYPRHDLAHVDDVQTLCASCHGRVDAPRAAPKISR